MTLVNSSSKVPKHRQVAAILRRRIHAKQYPAGAQLPTVRILSAELAVSVNVIHRAIRLLEYERLVESRHGYGTEVLDTGASQRRGLRFGLVQPFSPDLVFAGTIYCCVHKALEAKQDFCSMRSSQFDADVERKAIEGFIESGIEGLIVWPSGSDRNIGYYRQLVERIPTVFIDSKPEGVPAPLVSLDWNSLGRDLILYLASKPFKKMLILEEPRILATFIEMYDAMHATVKQIGGQDRFDFVEFDATGFVIKYGKDPEGQSQQASTKLAAILDEHRYAAMFSAQEEFLDLAFAQGSLARQHPNLRLLSITEAVRSPRSVTFHRMSMRRWVADWEKLADQAASLLHEMIFLRSRKQRRYNIKFQITQDSQLGGGFAPPGGP